jgi:hypothetical protein
MNNQQASAFQTRIATRSQRDPFISTEIHYRGCRIVWDARPAPDMLFWTGKAAVVLPENVSGVKEIHRITGSDYFLSEEDARDHLIGAAKDWIDNEAGKSREH